MFVLSKPSQTIIRSFVSAQKDQPFSYAEVGSSREKAPAGSTSDHNRIRLGAGRNDFDRAIAAVTQWKMFDTPWINLCWPDTPIEVDATVAVLVSHLGFWSLNACRIVYVIEEHEILEKYGFAYGTLPDHAAFSEERFTSRDLGCYLGLRPGRRNSGSSQPQLHIGKEGELKRERPTCTERKFAPKRVRMERWRQTRMSSLQDHSTNEGNYKTHLTLTGHLMEGLGNNCVLQLRVAFFRAAPCMPVRFSLLWTGIAMGTEFADCSRTALDLFRGVIGSWRDARTPQGFLVGFLQLRFRGLS